MSLQVWRMLQKPLCGNQMNLATLTEFTGEGNSIFCEVGNTLSVMLIIVNSRLVLIFSINFVKPNVIRYDFCNSSQDR